MQSKAPLPLAVSKRRGYVRRPAPRQHFFTHVSFFITWLHVYLIMPGNDRLDGTKTRRDSINEYTVSVLFESDMISSQMAQTTRWREYFQLWPLFRGKIYNLKVILHTIANSNIINSIQSTRCFDLNYKLIHKEKALRIDSQIQCGFFFLRGGRPRLNGVESNGFILHSRFVVDCKSRFLVLR